ncbi:unnamed protein product [Owenia fusiformis]|uniref:ZMYM2-like/QRICH1 C-terminal domain-containing protein n=1 Tax=Owenia fusiformis TaxID=6347 RepID=A0A8S4NJN2_OWEFU|nr:unnamed protein product [Owenia fusiformis]
MEGAMGMFDPTALVFTMWWNIVNQVGMRTGKESRMITWGDLLLHECDGDDKAYVTFRERTTKTRTGIDVNNTRKDIPRMYSTSGDINDPKDPFSIYRKFCEVRPPSMKATDSAFYLGINSSWNKDDGPGIWYTCAQMGHNTISRMLKDALTRGAIKTSDIDGKVANYSARKTLITTMRDNSVDAIDAIKITGHKRVESLNEYDKMSDAKKAKISHVISNFKPQSSSISDTATSSESLPVPQSALPSMNFEGIHRGTFYINFNIPPTGISKKVIQRKRCKRLVIDSDSSQSQQSMITKNYNRLCIDSL